MPKLSDRFVVWHQDPVAFVTEVLRDPETGRPFELYGAQVEFIRRAFILTSEGRLRFPEMIFSAPKKSGKTGFAGMLAIYVAVVIGGRYAEIYCLSNDYEQSVGRVFEAARRIVECSPLLAPSAKITADRIEFTSTGSFIAACASDYSGFVGANPALCIFDELWGYVSERAQRLFDEAVPSPTRKVSGRLAVSYSGFEGESSLLESLYKRGVTGVAVAPDLYESEDLLCYWTHSGPAPWQDDRWRAQMRTQLRPNAYLRLIENQWVSSESGFVDMEDYDRCVDAEARPVLSDPHLPVWLGLDGSYAHDSTAIAAVTFDTAAKRVRLVAHQIFVPSAGAPIDFAIVEEILLAFRRRFAIRQILFDPFQLVALSQRMVVFGLPMEPFPQTSSNLEASSNNLAELIRGANITLYRDPAIRLAMSRTVAVETPRGQRISKSKASARIDIVAALSFAALAAVREGQFGSGVDHAFQARAAAAFRAATIDRARSIDAPPENPLYANGTDWAARQDRADAQLRNSPRWKFRGF